MRISFFIVVIVCAYVFGGGIKFVKCGDRLYAEVPDPEVRLEAVVNLIKSSGGVYKYCDTRTPEKQEGLIWKWSSRYVNRGFHRKPSNPPDVYFKDC